MKSLVVSAAAALAVGAALSGSAAQAAVYDYTFTQTGGAGSIVSMKGTFTTAAPWSASGVEIIGMTGNLTSFDSVFGNPTYAAASYSPDGAFIYDNVLSSSQPYLDNPGVLFTTSDNPGGYWNLFSTDPTTYNLYESVPGQGYPVAETGTLSVTAVPEPATWAMMLAGFAFLGFAAWRKTPANGRGAFSGA